jgi:hypothetical protein
MNCIYVFYSFWSTKKSRNKHFFIYCTVLPKIKFKLLSAILNRVRPESLVRAHRPVHAEDCAWRLVLVDLLPLGGQRAARPRHFYVVAAPLLSTVWTSETETQAGSTAVFGFSRMTKGLYINPPPPPRERENIC